MRFGVITEVGDPESGFNMAVPMGELYISTNGLECRRVGGIEQMAFRVPVFTLGEILILNNDGREIAGRGRKPSKWLVVCEEFETLEEAVARAQDIPLGIAGLGAQLEEDRE